MRVFVWCAETVAICSVRGAYEYAGQKCSATARMYVPESLWPEVSGRGGREGGEGGREEREGRGEGREGRREGREGKREGRREGVREEGGREGERERGKEEIRREMGEGEVRNRRKVKGGIQACMETN